LKETYAQNQIQKRISNDIDRKAQHSLAKYAKMTYIEYLNSQNRLQEKKSRVEEGEEEDNLSEDNSSLSEKEEEAQQQKKEHVKNDKIYQAAFQQIGGDYQK